MQSLCITNRAFACVVGPVYFCRLDYLLRLQSCYIKRVGIWGHSDISLLILHMALDGVSDQVHGIVI